MGEKSCGFYFFAWSLAWWDGKDKKDMSEFKMWLWKKKFKYDKYLLWSLIYFLFNFCFKMKKKIESGFRND